MRWRVVIAVGGVALFIAGAAAFELSRRGLPRDMSRGGVELTFDVDVGRAVDERFARELDQAVMRLRSDGATITSIAPSRHAAELRGSGIEAADLDAALAGTSLAGTLLPGGGGGASVRFTDDTIARLADAVMQKEALVIHDRLTALERFVPTVKRFDERLVIGIPAVDAATMARAKRLLVAGGRFELREVNHGDALAAIALPEDGSVHRAADNGDGTKRLEGSTAALERIRAALSPASLPNGTEALVAPKPEGDAFASLFLVARRAAVDGESVREVESSIDRMTGGAKLHVTFDDGGAARLREVTTRLVGRRLAMVLDGRLLSVPIVRTPVPGGQVIVSLGGIYPADELSDLPLLVRRGPLPARLTLASERLIGRSR